MITYKQLEQFDLSDKEAHIYLATLELGSDTVQNIAKKANIHRVSAYDIIENLIKKGILSQIIKGKKRFFMAMEPEKMLDSLRYKTQLFAELMPELEAIRDKGVEKPKVMYFEGKEAVWNAYLDRLRHKPELKENLVYGSSEKLLTTFAKEYKKFTTERLEKGIKAKIIVERSESGLLEQKTASRQLREAKFLPPEKKFKTNTIIYGNRMMIVSWDSMMSVIIEDKGNAENQRFLFDLLWEYLP